MISMPTKKPPLLLEILLAVALAPACEDDGESPPAMDPERTAATGAGGIVPPPAPVGMAVLHGSSDYKTASVSLLERGTGRVLKDDCINSGAIVSGTTTLFSGDITLPSQPQRGNELLVIDRQRAVLTWVSPATCAPGLQLDVGTGFPSNPYDVLDLGAKAYVLRWNSNPNDASQGNDVLVVDPAARMVLGTIDLKPHATSDAAGARVLPRPSAALFHEGKVFVLLGNLAESYTPGPARVVVIDPTTDVVSGAIDLPGLENCGTMTLVPGAAPGIAVACRSSYTDPSAVARSGIAWIDLSTTPPTVSSLPASAFGRPVSHGALAVRDLRLGFTIVQGSMGDATSDELWSFDLAGRTVTKVREATGDYVFGVFVDGAMQRLFLTDANLADPKVHVFSIEPAGAPSLVADVKTNAAGLLPKKIVWY